MKFKYLTILAFATAMVSCDVLDKEPADSWESSSAITSYEDLVYAVNGVYESQTWTSATSSRGIYSGDFTLYADMKGEDFQCIGKKRSSYRCLMVFSNSNQFKSGNILLFILSIFSQSE